MSILRIGEVAMNWYTWFWVVVFLTLMVVSNYWARKYYVLLSEYLFFKKREFAERFGGGKDV